MLIIVSLINSNNICVGEILAELHKCTQTSQGICNYVLQNYLLTMLL